jgi:tRNA modification GTPase
MYASSDDTIVAISSAPGHALRGLVRLSGPAAIAIADRVFSIASTSASAVDNPARTLQDAAGFRAYDGRVNLEEDVTLPATALLFRAPRSYTRQDLVELHTTGSPPVLEMLVERCIAAGARPAEPGEFTARAFLSGAMTLPAAEGIAATIRARNDGQLRAARRLLRGELTDRVHAWRDQLADTLALVVADIDFAEEPIDFIRPDQLRAAIGKIQVELEGLIADTDAGARTEVVPRILLLGPPNAGKSTLLNALSGMDRAITSAVAGTTRDVLEAPVRLGKYDAVLLDAAGIDEDPDEILSAGRARAFDTATRVELVALVADATVPLDVDRMRELAVRGGAPTVLVLTKIDQISSGKAALPSSAPADLGPVAIVSAVTGEGLDELRAVLAAQIDDVATEGAGLLVSARQRAALSDAHAALARAAELAAGAASTLDCAEFLAAELQEALNAFAALTGAITTEDLLGRIFANFCIGK